MGGVLLLPLGTGGLSLEYSASEPSSDCVPVTGGGCDGGCGSNEAADRDCGCLELWGCPPLRTPRCCPRMCCGCLELVGCPRLRTPWLTLLSRLPRCDCRESSFPELILLRLGISAKTPVVSLEQHLHPMENVCRGCGSGVHVCILCTCVHIVHAASILCGGIRT